MELFLAIKTDSGWAQQITSFSSLAYLSFYRTQALIQFEFVSICQSAKLTWAKLQFCLNEKNFLLINLCFFFILLNDPKYKKKVFSLSEKEKR